LFLQDGWFGTEGPGKQPDRKRLGKELEKALELPFERVTVRDGGSFFADSRDDAPRPVDEKV
jgi:hypothetical protein